MTPNFNDDPAMRWGLFVLAGVAWALVGYLTKVQGDPNRELQPRKAGKTVLIGAVAGGIAAGSGDPLTTEGLSVAMATAVPVVDRLWNRYLPPSWGGSRTYGAGSTATVKPQLGEPASSQKQGEVAGRIAAAQYHELRAVAGYIPTINGNRSMKTLRTELRQTDPEIVLNAIRSAEAAGKLDPHWESDDG